MPTQRHLPDVLTRILEVVPATETALRAELAKILESSLYSAPELMAGLWHRTADTLNRFLGGRRADAWANDVADIFSGLSS